MPHPCSLPNHKGPFPFRDRLNKRRDIVRIMLAVSVYGDGIVRHLESRGKAGEKGNSFPQVLLVTDDGHVGERSEDLGRGVCGTVIHHEHWKPKPQSLVQDFSEMPPMVVCRDDDSEAKRHGLFTR
jgi:hypothetical protein